MMHVRNPSVGEVPAAPLVCAELDRILASDLFVRSERLSAFLRFIVERTLDRDGESLKEQVIAIELYGKDPSFDAAADPIVRVDARRLRDKLREYYASASDAPVVISVPKGRYTPVFTATAPGRVASGRLPRAAPILRRWPIAAAAIVLIAAAIWLTRSPSHTSDGPHSIGATSLKGTEEDPGLSPNGQFVAFAHSASDDEVHNIWIMPAAGGDAVNLTRTPDVDEDWPRWSPNGEWITFTRRSKNGPAVFKVSPLGGPVWLVANDGLDASWTPNGSGLVMAAASAPGRHNALVYWDSQTGTRLKKLTDAPLGYDDRHPRVSPDGQTLAFVRGGQGRSAILRIPFRPFSNEAMPEPEIVGQWETGMSIGGLEWMPDGGELLAAEWIGSSRQLVRIPVNPGGREVAVAGIPSEVAGFSVSTVGPKKGPPYRLAVSIGQFDIGLRLVHLAASSYPASSPPDVPFFDSTRVDIAGRFSPDGQQVAFVSNRNGSFQVWVANRDGSAPAKPVTRLEDGIVGVGSWSPGGQQIVFDATIKNRTNIYVVGKDGVGFTQLTNESENASDPEWSSDGQWIYYSLTRSGSTEIWRMRKDGRSRTKLKSEPGFDFRESPGEGVLYFLDRPRGVTVARFTPLKRMPIGGGPIEDVGIRVAYGAWDVTDFGIVYVAEQTEGIQNRRGGKNVINQYDFASHSTRTIARLEFPIGPFGVPRFLAVSRDGHWALASRTDRWERDITVLDGFR